jgi:hypothetical protein
MEDSMMERTPEDHHNVIVFHCSTQETIDITKLAISFWRIIGLGLRTWGQGGRYWE